MTTREFRHFYQSHYPKLFNYVASRVSSHQDTEEIVQDSFLGLLDSLPLYAGKSSLWTYLVAIARHEIADHYRKLYAKKAIRSVPFVDQVYDEPLYSGEETREVFEQVMTRLSQEERLLLEWKYDLGLSVKQIATKMGLDFKAAESRLFRARKQFQVAYLELTDP